VDRVVLFQDLVDRNAVGFVSADRGSDRVGVDARQPRPAQTTMARLDVRGSVAVEYRPILEIRQDVELRLQRSAERLEYRRQLPGVGTAGACGKPEIGGTIGQVDGQEAAAHVGGLG